MTTALAPPPRVSPLTADLDFAGRRVLVTGAANGFGAAIADLFAAHGATLVLADQEADAVTAKAAAIGPRATAIVYDQADVASVERLAAAAGDVDVLVNNAGRLLTKPLLETSAAEIRGLIDVDLVGVMVLTPLLARGMVARGRGVVVNIGSQTAFCGGEGRGIYAAAKAAIAQYTRAAAVEWGPHGVRAVCVAPGRSITRMTRHVVAGPSGDRGLDRVPLGRWGSAEEVAKLVVFLASDAASYVTGETVIADGGYVIG
ncbi:MAG: SDR family oxidoreductase [Alphaproteobacteria bacterium]|nr:SDR family oxidoreductase [Alphaproteobacteria bacterium]